MTLKVYVAGSSKEMPRVKRVMQAVREAGHEITFDWVAEIEKVGTPNPTDIAQRKASAQRDVEGVIDADVLLVLHPGPGIVTAGLWFEMGVQYGCLYRMAVDYDGDPVVALAEFLRRLPTFIAYETEVFTGPCIFDALFETKPILDANILPTLQHFDTHRGD